MLRRYIFLLPGKVRHAVNLNRELKFKAEEMFFFLTILSNGMYMCVFPECFSVLLLWQRKDMALCQVERQTCPWSSSLPARP